MIRPINLIATGDTRSHCQVTKFKLFGPRPIRRKEKTFGIPCKTMRFIWQFLGLILCADSFLHTAWHPHHPLGGERKYNNVLRSTISPEIVHVTLHHVRQEWIKSKNKVRSCANDQSEAEKNLFAWAVKNGAEISSKIALRGSGDARCLVATEDIQIGEQVST